jgi:uncharacterized membrane protein
MVLGSFAQRLPCLQSARGPGGALELNWSNERPYADYCYSDVIALYTVDRLDQPGEIPYRTSWVSGAGPARQVQYVEYPVLTGLLMWAGARAAQGLAGGSAFANLPAVVIYFDLIAIVLAASWLFVVGAVSALLGRARRYALAVALSPLVIAQLFTNFDAVAVALATGGLLAWSRRRPVLAGVLLGLGGAAKLYPLFFLIPLLVLCLRAGRLRAGSAALAGAAASWAIVNAPIALAYPSGWSYFWRFSVMRNAGLESIYSMFPYLTGLGLDRHLPAYGTPVGLNDLSGSLFVLACLAICGVALSAPRRPRLAPLCLLVVAAFLLTNKVYSPQYSLWLVPLAALALPRWRLLAGWMIVDALVWLPTLAYQRPLSQGGVSQGYLVASVLVRDAALLAICGVVIAEIYRPARDRLRGDGEDDGCGGVLDGALDRVTLGRRGVIVAS